MEGQEQFDPNQMEEPNYMGEQQYQEMEGTQAMAERDPKKYAYYPSSWTQKIIPAGKVTFKSESISNIMTGGA